MIKRNIKYIIIGIAALVFLSGMVIYEKIFNAKHREIFEEPTEYTISADDLQFYFADNQKVATKKYTDKVIEVYGSVTEVGDSTLVLEDKIQVYFLSDLKQQPTLGDKLSIKGRCVGFDELLITVKIDQATTIKIN